MATLEQVVESLIIDITILEGLDSHAQVKYIHSRCHRHVKCNSFGMSRYLLL
jgi:hypothetical protein